MSATRFSYLTHLECSRCESNYDADEPNNLCSCGSPLLARYDLDALRSTLDFAEIERRGPSLWRYHELLPVREPESIVSFGEGYTPIVRLRNLERDLGMSRLLMKDEGLLPTGTFKARGAAVGVSRARELGIGSIAMPTNGNAGAAWSTYAARAGMTSLIVMPVDAPDVTRRECTVTGAELYLVDGLIGDAGAIVAESVANGDWFDVSTLKEPYRLEGKKTMGLEIFEQLSRRMPDVIVYPTGGGVGLIGIYKAIAELRALGLFNGPAPRLVSVQAEGCTPVVRAFENRHRTVEPFADSQTVAFGINVPRPLGGQLVLDAIYATDGHAVAVSDSEIIGEMSNLARTEGLFICPEGAATVAAVRQMRASGWLNSKQEVLLLNTGTGIKYPGLVPIRPVTLRVGETVRPAVPVEVH